MSRFSVASHWSILASLALLPAHAALAQPATSLLLFKQPAPAQPLRWQTRLARLGPFAADARSAALSSSGIPRARLAALAEVERLLSQARLQAADLDERAALVELARAAALADELGDVPGAALWQAEVHLRIGITAAQAGLAVLSDSAFRRASALDPARQLQSAEAPPEVVARFERAARMRARSPSGRFVVRASVAAAQVYLDDVAQGPAPVRVQAVVGRHVLRVEAPGYRSYGAMLDVLEGERPDVAVLLSPHAALQIADVLSHAVRQGDYPAAARALAALEREAPPAPALLVLETSRDGRRALLVRCRATGCAPPLRLSARAVPGVEERFSTRANGRWSERQLQHARAWLQPKSAAQEPWWERWYVWGGAAVAGAALATALALSARPEPERRLSVVIEPAAR